MNLNNLNHSASDSDSDQSIESKTKQHQFQETSRETLSLPSAPLDPEWVSPFTLPPLPALRKNCGHSKKFRSPEERLLHQRSSSSAYYAAAWGSPYATPSPSKSPSQQQQLRRRSRDSAAVSPLASRAREFTPEITRFIESSPLSSTVDSARPKIRQRANSWDKSTSLSERFNWLSESDLSGSERDFRAGKTPTRNTYLKDLKASLDRVRIPRSKAHQIQESVATITPETFNAASESVDSHTTESQASMEAAVNDSADNPAPDGGLDKPLPRLPPAESGEATADKVESAPSPQPPQRPRMTSVQSSYQRSKRKIVWKGKTCIIALPLTNRESAGLPPLLSSDEIRQRMQNWAYHGYDINALSMGSPQDTIGGFGQSRPLYPDPHDMYVERKSDKPLVHIPDQTEWDAWVDYLKEEKLRALGVTPSNSEPPMSAQSPFSTLSRVSSTYPSLTASPTVRTHSAIGTSIRNTSNMFSPPLGHPGGIRSHGGSHGPSPSISGFHMPMHGCKQSISQPRLTSPYDYPITHPGSFAAGMRNTPNGYGVRQFSPPTAAHLQSLGQALSPIIPTIPSNDGSRGITQNRTMEQIANQQQQQQQLQRQLNQHNRQHSCFPLPQSKPADQAPQTPNVGSPVRQTPEIMHPTPRSHRHNLSAALQRGVDNAEAARIGHKFADTMSEQPNSEQQVNIEEVAESAVDDEQEPELPVLRRPETIPDEDGRSEIETNPSIAASPLLADDKNPFAVPFTKLQQINQTLQPQSQHKPNLSMSKFNVDAPVFDPTARFASSNFTFGDKHFEPTQPVIDNKLVGGVRSAFATKHLSVSKLNVEAPSFTPSFVMHSTPVKDGTPAKETPAKQSFATPSKASFTFSSPSFNVDAPEFKPSSSFSFGAKMQSSPQHEQNVRSSAGSIFGIVTVDPNSRVNRRGTKMVPIIRPQSKEEEEIEQSEDEEGRINAPSDRQKRARKFGDNEDEQLSFASSAPFDHAQGLSNVAIDVKNVSAEPAQATISVQQATTSKHLESKSVAENQKLQGQVEEGELKAVSTTTAADVVDNVTRPSGSVKDSNQAPEADEQRDDNVVLHKKSPSAELEETLGSYADVDPEVQLLPVNASPRGDRVREDATEAELEDRKLDSEPVKSFPPSNHRSMFSFSALAKPFEFRPVVASSFVPQRVSQTQSSQNRSASGLMASRFANPSPEPESKASAQANDSELQDMYEYIGTEAVTSTELPSTREHRLAESPLQKLSSGQIERCSAFTENLEELSSSDTQHEDGARSPSRSSRIEESMPSYEEIDAVMKQFEDNPDLGVERADTPVKSTPLMDMRLAPAFRSDAPSPSPRRLTHGPPRRRDWGLGIHRLNGGVGEVSDWNDEFSPRQEDKLQSQAQYFDSRVNDTVDGILEARLGPLEEALQAIKQSLVGLNERKQRPSIRRTMSAEDKAESDADDEDEYDAFEPVSTYRSRSPGRNQRKADKIRAIVLEAMASYKPASAEQQSVASLDIQVVLQEMRTLTQAVKQQPQLEQSDLRATMDDVLSSHPQIKAIIDRGDFEAIKRSHTAHLQTIEASLNKAESLAEEEAARRKSAEAEVQNLNRQLQHLRDEAEKHHAAEERARSAAAMNSREMEAYRQLQSDHTDIIKNKKALEDTLAEYRATSHQFRDDIRNERARNQELVRTMDNLRKDFSEKLESRQALRSQMERLQEKMSQVMHDVHEDQAEWREKEHRLVLQNKTVQAALDHEIRHREKVEIERDNLDKEHRESLRFRVQYEHAQQATSLLQASIGNANNDCKILQDAVFKLERDLAYEKESAAGHVTLATSKLQTELDASRTTLENVKSNADAQILHLQKRLDDTELELEEQKTRHSTGIAETAEAYDQALQEANEKHEAALKELQSSHERKFDDLKEQHTRALHNSSDDLRRIEDQLNEKLTLSDERIQHLQSQLKDLSERLEITKSAARAAVEAATAKVANIPTPAPSVVASPPQRVSSASLHFMKGSDLPEKISPQAMRESIMVLQDQLQNRERTIETLEAEIASLDKDAPAKVKERDNEISLLRELLAVRVDDLNEIITTLSQPNYDRLATKNAAIRLRANLQMEQQLKERAVTMGSLTSSLPSLATISSLAQSPRGLPMAAAAALGNWRKARDFSLSAVSDIASNITQTPSKSTAGSPTNFLAGMMTPPNTTQRTPSPSSITSTSPPPTMRPLAAAAVRKGNPGASEARPLRVHTAQARTLSSRKAEKRRESIESSSSEAQESMMSRIQPRAQSDPPITPTISRNTKNLDLEADVDGDASPFNASEHEAFESDTPRKEPVEA